MTRKNLLTCTAAALFLGVPLSSPAAATGSSALTPTVAVATIDEAVSTHGKALARRGNDDRGGRGHDDRDDSHHRGGDDDDHRDDRGGARTDDRVRDRTDRTSGGRDEPRIPGGSGCDDARDLIEHPECRI